jgi:hypothetical protein
MSTQTREIPYPVFLRCATHAKDPFWNTVFEDLAYGRTQHGSYITKGFLCCSYKGREFSYKIKTDNIEKLYKDVYRLLKEKMGIMSSREKMKKREEFYITEERIKKNRNDSWKSVRQKTVKDLLIENFILSKRKKYGLSISQCSTLISSISLAMVFKVIKSTDINYSDGVIHSIEGIEYQDGKIILMRDIFKDSVYLTPEIPTDRKSMKVLWEKYLKNLKKKQFT